MDEKIVGLKGKPVLTPGTPDESIRRILADLITRNERGELLGLLCVYLNTNDEVATNWAGDRPYNRAAAIGGLEVLKLHFWRDTDHDDTIDFLPAG